MSRTRWTMDMPDDVPLEIEGCKFSTNDEGASMMGNLVCSAMGRHVHIDYCRADDEAECTGNEELRKLPTVVVVREDASTFVQSPNTISIKIIRARRANQPRLVSGDQTVSQTMTTQVKTSLPPAPFASPPPSLTTKTT
ncbi:hypothetical protein EV363DRAFT_1401533 [Boletus edulis]|nr:hypothetical protein EV363DRAFT_1401533 [Boletus edulis]